MSSRLPTPDSRFKKQIGDSGGWPYSSWVGLLWNSLSRSTRGCGSGDQRESFTWSPEHVFSLGCAIRAFHVDVRTVRHRVGLVGAIQVTFEH